MSTMDPSRRKLIAVLILQFASFITLFFTSTVNVETSISLNQNVVLLIQQYVLENEKGGSLQGRIQSYDRAPGYADIDLVGSYSNIVFKQRFRMTKQTFMYVC